ncbi:cell wall-binding repeat-containing protein [Herbiconiux sp. A18JL235]|uniref:Cell wall-binding repeat-containing protein n=1 Tax=Herbiconiux sp. A18JL235 TaxID=3152363 RepID=A0AB39BH16_9MICO
MSKPSLVIQGRVALVLLIGACFALLPAATSSAAPYESSTRQLSQTLSLPPASANQPVESVAISGDGKYAAFSTRATNLSDLANGVEQVYLSDLQTGALTMVSARSGVAGDMPSTQPSVSDDGRFVAYTSLADNLAGGSPARGSKALVWDRATGTTQLVSLTDGPSPAPATVGVTSVRVSGDGTAVAFLAASKLTLEDPLGTYQVYVRNLRSASTTMVSVNPLATVPSGSHGVDREIAISRDGSVVVFTSTDSLSSQPGGGRPQVYARMLRSGSTELVSVNSDGTAGGDGSSVTPTVSANGTAVAFASNSSDISPLHPAAGGTSIYVRDLTTKATALGTPTAMGSSGIASAAHPSLSEDGRFLAFDSAQKDVVAEGSGFPGSFSQVYVRDRVTGTVVVASRNLAGTTAGNDRSELPTLSSDGSLVAFRSAASDLTATAPSLGSPQAFVSGGHVTPTLQRIAGADRYTVSANVSSDAFTPEGIVGPTVYVASGEGFADALPGSAVAGYNTGPILLVGRDTISGDLRAELTRLTPRRIVVLGGPNSISAQVENDLKSFSTSVDRVAGPDRFSGSIAVSRTFTSSAVAYVASGENFPDALAGAAAAGREKAPVLLTQKDSLPTGMKEELLRLGVTKIVVLGGPASVSDGVVASLGAVAPTTRIAGSDRYEGAAAVSRTVFAAGAKTVFVASGEVFPDALSGGASAIKNGAPVILVTKNSIPAAAAVELDRLNPNRIVVLGGLNTVSQTVYESLEQYLAR